MTEQERKDWEIRGMRSGECGHRNHIDSDECCHPNNITDKCFYDDCPIKVGNDTSDGVRRFYLDRKVDESGMSGTGKVAEGVVLPNGLAVMWWLVPPNSIQIYSSIFDLEHIHSHGKGTTKVVFEKVK